MSVLLPHYQNQNRSHLMIARLLNPSSYHLHCHLLSRSSLPFLPSSLQLLQPSLARWPWLGPSLLEPRLRCRCLMSLSHCRFHRLQFVLLSYLVVISYILGLIFGQLLRQRRVLLVHQRRLVLEVVRQPSLLLVLQVP